MLELIQFVQDNSMPTVTLQLHGVLLGFLMFVLAAIAVIDKVYELKQRGSILFQPTEQDELGEWRV